MVLIKFNDKRNKKNYRIVETFSKFSFEKYGLEFNLYDNVWISVRDFDTTDYFDTKHNIFYAIGISIIGLSLFLFFNIISLLITIFGSIYLLIVVIPPINKRIRHGCLDDLKKDLNNLTRQKNKKIVVGFDASGNELTGQNLERVNKLNKLNNLI